MAKDKFKSSPLKNVGLKNTKKDVAARPPNKPLTNSQQIAFAEERLRLHESDPESGFSVEAFKAYFALKYGF